MAFPVEDRRQLVLRILYFRAFQSCSICVSRPRGSGEDGNVAEFGERHFEHRSFVGKHKICALRDLGRPQGVSAAGSDVFQGTVAIHDSLGRRSNDRMVGDHITQSAKYSLGTETAAPEFHCAADGLHDHERYHLLASLLSASA